MTDLLARVRAAHVEIPDDFTATWWVGRRGAWREAPGRPPPPHKVSMGWGPFVGALREAASGPALPDKSAGPAFCASVMDRGYRGADHVIRTYGLTVDIDDPRVDWAGVRDWLVRAGVAFVLAVRGGKVHVQIPIDPMDGRGAVVSAARVFLGELANLWPGVDLAMARPEQPTFAYAPVGGAGVAVFVGDGHALDLSAWRTPGAEYDDGRALPGRDYLLQAAGQWVPGVAPFDGGIVRRCREPHRGVLGALIAGEAPALEPGSRHAGLYAAVWSLAAADPGMDPGAVAAALVGGGQALGEGREWCDVSWWAGAYEGAAREIGIQRAAREMEDRDKAGPWYGRVCRDKSGAVTPAATNCAIILRHDPDVVGCLGWDVLHDRGMVLRPTPWGAEPGPLDVDRDWAAVAEWCRGEARIGALFSRGAVMDAMEAAARGCPYDPLIDYLRGLVWDGVPRLGSWLVDWLGAPDTEIVREMGRRWMIGGAARGLAPGAKVDSVLVLQGDQGLGKSSAFELLSRGWFTDRIGDPKDKDSMAELQGVWIVEIAELESLRSVDMARLKGFLTRQTDVYRAAYARSSIPRPRRCIFGASTNEHHYLSDPTGARRWWPVTITRSLDRGAFAGVVDQLWAEAVAQYDAGAPWHLDARLAAMAAAEAEDRREESPLEETIETWAAGEAEPFTLAQCMAALGIAKTDNRARYQVVGALRALGYNSVRVRGESTKKRVWKR